MNIKEPHKRLFSLWGRIDRQHNEYIASRIPATGEVLDIGCGYGSLVHFLTEKGHKAVGIDDGQEFIDIGRKIFPGAVLKHADAAVRLDFKDNSLDAVVLKDVMHHIYRESDFTKAFSEIRRVLKPGGVVVVFDPNPHIVLKLGRMLIAHKDPECTWKDAKAVLETSGFTVREIGFYESIGLVLSGGYVSPRLTPNFKGLNTFIAKVNHRVSRGINRLGLGRHILFRYSITAVKN